MAIELKNCSARSSSKSAASKAKVTTCLAMCLYFSSSRVFTNVPKIRNYLRKDCIRVIVSRYGRYLNRRYLNRLILILF